MPLVSKPTLFAREGERLARTTARPNRSMIWPNPAESKSAAPSTEAGEEMALSVSFEIDGPDVGDASGIDIAIRDQPFHD